MLETKENLKRELEYHEGMITVIKERLKAVDGFFRSPGRVFEHNGVNYIAVENPNADEMSCKLCTFEDNCKEVKEVRGHCSRSKRGDNKDVYFSTLSFKTLGEQGEDANG